MVKEIRSGLESKIEFFAAIFELRPDNIETD